MTQAYRRAVRWVVPGYALILAVTVTAPLLAPGYLLLRDAVSTPRSFFSDAALGLTEAAPRAVPQDFLIAALTTVLDGGLVVKVLLIGGLCFLAYFAATGHTLRREFHELEEEGLSSMVEDDSVPPSD